MSQRQSYYAIFVSEDTDMMPSVLRSIERYFEVTSLKPNFLRISDVGFKPEEIPAQFVPGMVVEIEGRRLEIIFGGVSPRVIGAGRKE